MIALDTNILVRYIVQDDSLQSPLATAFIESATHSEPYFVTMVTVIELVWVLKGCYKADKSAVVGVLDTLLRTRELHVERADVVLQAIHRFKTSKADFADCLIFSVALAEHCQEVVTFDQSAAKTVGMRLLA